jgi:hypothetical protein
MPPPIAASNPSAIRSIDLVAVEKCIERFGIIQVLLQAGHFAILDAADYWGSRHVMGDTLKASTSFPML